jgi:hypothetical protein
LLGIIGHAEIGKCEGKRSFQRRSHYQGHFSRAAGARYINRMNAEASPAKYRCAQCDQPETSCDCEKFCCLCQALTNIRFCGDGLMYCEDCRKACDYKTSDLSD